MIEVNNLVKKYAGDCTAVNNVSFSVAEGEFIAVTGRSGSGKSTLLKCVSGLLKPDSGKVIIGGADIHSLNSAERRRFRNKTTGFVFQSYALEPKYTAFENIELPLLIAGVSKRERREMIARAAGFIGVSDILKKPAELLSGGEKQRVAIARALVNSPKIIFADEPCGNLDKKNSDAVMDMFLEIKRLGTTIVMVTHQHEDALRADRIIEMLDGVIINEDH